MLDRHRWLLRIAAAEQLYILPFLVADGERPKPKIHEPGCGAGAPEVGKG
jgi:hypothetical protein